MPVTDVPSGKRRVVPARPWILLLVDDEPDILETLGDLVEHELPGVKVIRANSGREGLGALQAERIDGIISDFNMVGMDGLEFLCIARQCHPTIPRVMLTAYQDRDLTRMAETDAAVQKFLYKGLGAEALLDQVEALLTYEPAIHPAP
jgi:DNA-binding response OmpR family regulator